MQSEKVSLYLHIPFCRNVCHYCDFAKTARFDEDLVSRYFKQLTEHTKHWLSELKPRIGSVFFGGGTPGLFTREYASVFAAMAPYLDPHCEISLEANPLDLNSESLEIWRGLGINRVSI